MVAKLKIPIVTYVECNELNNIDHSTTWKSHYFKFDSFRFSSHQSATASTMNILYWYLKKNFCSSVERIQYYVERRLYIYVYFYKLFSKKNVHRFLYIVQLLKLSTLSKQGILSQTSDSRRQDSDTEDDINIC